MAIIYPKNVTVKLWADRDAKAGPFDRCIFCAESGVPKRTDEHALPRALGSRLVLVNATCEKCRDITSRLESQVLNKMFAEVRAQFQFKSGASKKKRQKFPVQITRDGKVETIRVPLSDHPTVLALPVFAPPTLIAPNPEIHEFRPAAIPRWWINEDYAERMARIMSRTGAQNVSVPSNYDSITFGRMLAKIAHCLTMARLGCEGFTPMLTDIILSGNGQLHRFVGNPKFDLPDPSPIPQKHLGSLNHQFYIETVRHNEFKNLLVVCRIRLFCSIKGTPVYTVAVGEGGPMATEQLMRPSWP